MVVLCSPTRLSCTQEWGLHRVGGSEHWIPPAPTSPAPSKATQPPLASNFTGFWQILLRQPGPENRCRMERTQKLFRNSTAHPGPEPVKLDAEGRLLDLPGGTAYL
jgi:hypothetical protein